MWTFVSVACWLACWQDGQAAAPLETWLSEGADERIIAWFKENPDDALPFIDQYLEGGLKMIEQDEPAEKARASFDRGVKFAALADKAFDETIFSDYARSFAGWNEQQQKDFRAGQRTFREGSAKHKAGESVEALKLFRESVGFSKPLNDWWGMAMAYGGLGEAKLAIGQSDDAIQNLQRSAEIHQRLRLRLGHAAAMISLARAQTAAKKPADALETLERTQKVLKADDPAPLHEKLRMARDEAKAAQGVTGDRAAPDAKPADRKPVAPPNSPGGNP